MTLEELIETYPEVETYFKNMPEELKTRYTIRKFPPGTIIHQKDYPLDYFGIVCSGDHRVINEFENGNVFMIEKMSPLILSVKLRSLRKNLSHPYPSKH